MKKIAFQGEKGAFSEDAAYKFWKNEITPIPNKSFRNVFDSVKNHESTYGIIPIENSFTGSIHQNIDLLLEYHLHITGEIILRIQHNLLTLTSIRIEDIKQIYSHPQAIEQCSKYLDSLKHVEIISMYDTAGSARFIKVENREYSGAIASIRAAQDYGLHTLKKSIENNPQNFTRFIVISPKIEHHHKSCKTSIVFTTKDIPGALFKALSVFALRDINLLKIESRPLRKGPWKYWFYLDFEGSMEEEPCQNAIHHLEEITSFIKILGSYPKGKVYE